MWVSKLLCANIGYKARSVNQGVHACCGPPENSMGLSVSTSPLGHLKETDRKGKRKSHQTMKPPRHVQNPQMIGPWAHLQTYCFNMFWRKISSLPKYYVLLWAFCNKTVVSIHENTRMTHFWNLYIMHLAIHWLCQNITFQVCFDNCHLVSQGTARALHGNKERA